jgi:hypothetical protein
MLPGERKRSAYIVSDGDTGQTDGTTYWPGGGATGQLEIPEWDNVLIHVVDIPGIAGTNTYTWEFSIDGTNWYDTTNDWFGVANFTTHFMKERRGTLARFLRLKRVRTGDAANNDGGSTIVFHAGYGR